MLFHRDLIRAARRVSKLFSPDAQLSNISIDMTSGKPKYFSMGSHTFNVPMSLFDNNRKNLQRMLKLSNGGEYNDIVLLQGGEPVSHYSTDVEYVFQQEPYFHWMFGVTEPGFYGAYLLASGKSILFLPKLPEEYGVWMGKLLTPEDVVEKYQVDLAFYVDQIGTVLKDFLPRKLLTLFGTNTDSQLKCKEAYFDGISDFIVDNSILHPAITECRVVKSSEEIEVMKYVNDVSSKAHKLVMEKIKPGWYEYQAEATFMHYCYNVGGCRNVSYTCICGTGHNGSILHYGHAAAPNNKRINDGDMCLFDMGASYYGYSSDITVSFPANGKFTDKQKIIYNAVLLARNAVIKAMKPGISWVDMHVLAYQVMLQELKNHGLLRGDINEMIKDDIGAVFQPHGLGHFLGCDVHDVGGYNVDCPERPTKPGLKSLRTARVLKPGMVLTVEPGCYFIDALLDEALMNEVKRKYLVMDVIQEYRGFGGVRIEDNVLVTDTGIEVLTKVPRTIEEIEEHMNTA